MENITILNDFESAVCVQFRNHNEQFGCSSLTNIVFSPILTTTKDKEIRDDSAEYMAVGVYVIGACLRCTGQMCYTCIVSIMHIKTNRNMRDVGLQPLECEYVDISYNQRTKCRVKFEPYKLHYIVGFHF